MDSRRPENVASRPLRRSTRHSSGKVFSVVPTPRGPLKRTKKKLENQPPVAAVNGSRDVETGSEDEGSPSKKSRPETEEAVGGRGDENEMDVQESVDDMEENGDQEIRDTPEIRQDPSHGTHQSKFCQVPPPLDKSGALGDGNVSPQVVLGERCQSRSAVNSDADWIKTKRVKPPTKGPEAHSKPATQTRPPASCPDVLNPKITSMAEYQRRMEAIAKSSVNHHVLSPYPALEKSYATRQRVNNFPKQKENVQHKKQEGIRKTAGSSSRGFMWYLWRLVLLVLLTSAVLLAHETILERQRTARGGERPGPANPEHFAHQLSLVETQFPGQRPDVWKWSKIHLERHLNTAQPTEPVSLIFAAGHSAERTLHCLAQRLATSFSSALNASVLHIDGAGKASQDSDEAKLDIDRRLRAAFEGDQPVAVIHRLEELPPGSTLIFYRYCDHENAAYKRVFLLFTVLLPQEEVTAEHSLKDVEEMVHDYVKERLVGSGSGAAFNAMDSDKFGGLWSRIAHLILPVVAEDEVEQTGC